MLAVTVENVEYRYGEQAALKGVSFEVREGECFALCGPNGGGKTTLFQTLSTLKFPQKGTVRIFGADTREEGAVVRKQLGVVFQMPALDKRLTCRENLEAQGMLYDLPRAERRARATEWLKTFGLLDRENSYALKLSGGEQRRLEIAKALMHRPRLLLLDEPTTGLDPLIRRTLWTILRDLQKQHGMTVLCTTHFLEEADAADRLLILHKGKVVAEGTPSDLKASIQGDVVAVRSDEGDAHALAGRIAERFAIAPQLANGQIRVEIPNGHEFVPELMRAFGNEISAVTLGRASLEDVFIRRTSGEAHV